MSSPADLRSWQPQRPRLRPVRLLIIWIASAVALMLAASVLSGVTITGFWGAMLVAATIAVLNAFVPPIVAALRLPATLLTGFLILLAVNALLRSRGRGRVRL
jgi:putative membrane protein